ncbi:MAG: oxygen-independent coproporphyrinogen III oxidase [Rhizobiaceae bacterium]
MDRDFILRRSAPVPRYTSYPTAPHFHAGVGEAAYAQWLGNVPQDARLSLYLHIPFCDRLCWFCGCHTKQTRRYDPVEAYIQALTAEIATVGRHLGGRGQVSAVHFGGGSPTLMSSKDMNRVNEALKSAFSFIDSPEISVEIDPNDMDDDRYDGLKAIGLTRASLGVQDFDPKVQAAINRLQSFEETKAVVERVRELGVHSVNLDMLYGLPHQTEDSVAATARQVLSLRPDRIALFGYAHVPWMKKHQTMIAETDLPDTAERFAQSVLAARLIAEAGYQGIGIDHFALPDDSLAVAARDGTMRRNFQGYTDDSAEFLIGMGASSIGQTPLGHVQNMPATAEYERLALAGRLPVVRGLELGGDDRLRGHVIERLMCDFEFSRADTAKAFGESAAAMIANEADAFIAADPDGLLERHGEVYAVSPRGKPFVRAVAAHFDAYLTKGTARHSLAV